MSKFIKKAILIINILIGISIIWYSYNVLNSEYFITIQTVSFEYKYLIFSILAYIVSHLFRVARLFVLLGQAATSLRSLVRLHLISNSINIILPLRLGEFYRIVLLTQKYKEPVQSTLLIIVERVLDLTVMLILGIILSTTFGVFSPPLSNLLLLLFALLLFLLTVASLAVFIVNQLYFNLLKEEKLISKYSKLLFFKKFRSFFNGDRQFKREQLIVSALLTVWVWLFEILSFSFFYQILTDLSSYLQVVFASFLGFLAPSGPASFGSQQLSVSVMTRLPTEILSYVLYYQLIILGCVGVIPGLILMLWSKGRKYFER
jgi:hypothetical protein